tara:strand:- start:160 stop:663 length:504 start_codon:yes stop_codon:yes gene_type:complete
MSSIKLKGSSSGEAILSTDATAAKVTVDKNVDITGNIVTSAQSQVEAVNTPAQVTVNSATATSLASVSITTTGKPVMLTACGESNPGQTGGWFYYRLYRGSTEIGARHKAENGGTSSQNYVFAITHIDSPAAGTYTYSIQAYQGSGTHVFGEDGDVEGAVITAHEIL